METIEHNNATLRQPFCRTAYNSQCSDTFHSYPRFGWGDRMTDLPELLTLFAAACVLMAAPFGWIIYRDLKNNPHQELEP